MAVAYVDTALIGYRQTLLERWSKFEWLRQLNSESISSSGVVAMLPNELRMSSLEVSLLSGHQSSHLETLMPSL